MVRTRKRGGKKIQKGGNPVVEAFSHAVETAKDLGGKVQETARGVHGEVHGIFSRAHAGVGGVLKTVAPAQPEYKGNDEDKKRIEQFGMVSGGRKKKKHTRKHKKKGKKRGGTCRSHKKSKRSKHKKSHKKKGKKRGGTRGRKAGCNTCGCRK
uniref:Uncharacterized protein n=1 Tax=viral metagenome TaxID=1070528 RepID=A0A6C0CPM1_9ZZZZ